MVSFHLATISFAASKDSPILFDNDIPYRIIEFDGEQHFRPIQSFGGLERFEKQKKNDFIKNQYALSHNIPLVRIPYDKRDSMNLDDLLGTKYLIKGGICFGEYDQNENPIPQGFSC